MTQRVTSGPELRDDSGFTLIETLVAALTGLIIAGAAFAILEVSLHQTSRFTDVAEATQLGRTSMTRIVDELHSACISQGFKPVLEGSGKSQLIVVNAYSKAAEIPVGANTRTDEIVWSKAAETLTDSTYASSGGAWPKFTFPAKGSPTTVTRIGSRVTESGSTPIFQYFEYAAEATSSGASTTLKEVTPPEAGFKAAEAEKIVAVTINFNTTPASGGFKQAGRSVDFSNQVTFTFSAPTSQAKIEGGPCE